MPAADRYPMLIASTASSLAGAVIPQELSGVRSLPEIPENGFRLAGWQPSQ